MEKAIVSSPSLPSRLGFVIGQAGLLLRLQKQRVRRLDPKITIRVQTEQFILKTVDTAEERSQVFRLRYRVFHRELMQKRMPIGWDIDAFDFKCDHLVIIDRASGNVIGTYRMLCSRWVDRFYSADEFDLSALKDLPGVKLELGRACVDERFRTGAVLNLLWRGIGEYIRRTGADYLLGCSSIHSTEAADLNQVMDYVRRKGCISEGLWFETMPAFRASESAKTDGDAKLVGVGDDARLKDLFPQLLGSYLKAGAKVCGGPAIDRAMKCADVLTILKISEMNPSFAKRYEVWSGEV